MAGATYQYGIKLAVDGEGAVVSATDKVGKGFKDMGEDADRGTQLANSLISKLGALAAAYVGTQTIRAFVDTADAMAGMESRLRNVIGASGDYKAVQDDLYRISQNNNVSIKDTATLYTRLLPTLEKMGGDTRNASLMTDALSTALRVNKASASESSSAILQFSQAMASGVLRGEEFNSVNEAAPQFLDALATALGVNKGELRKMAEEGKLTADVVGNKMPAMMRILQEQTYALKDTLSDSMSDMRNDTALLAAELDKTSGATQSLGDFVGGLSGLVREFTTVLANNKDQAVLAGQGFDTVGTAIRVVGTIAETVLVLMSEVTFALTSIGREAGGLAAQVAAVVRGNFAEARQIGIEMKADADAARAQVDKYNASVLGMTDKVLQGRAALKDHSLSAKENGDEMQRLTGHSGNTAGGYNTLTAATKASKDADALKKAALKELAVEEKRQAEMLVELSGFSKDYATKTGDLADLYASGKITLDKFTQAHADLLAKQPLNLQATKDAIAAAKEQNAEWDKSWVAMEKDREQVEKRIGASRTYLEKIQNETSDLKLSKSELALVTAERELERLGVIKGTEAYDAYIDKIRQAVVDKENTAATVAEIKKVEDAAKATAGRIEQGMIDSLFRAFESGKDFFSTLWSGIKNTFKTEILTPIIKDVLTPFKNAAMNIFNQLSQQVISPIISAIVNPITGALGLGSVGGSASAATGGSGVLGQIGNAAGLGGMMAGVNGSISSGISAAVGWLSNTAIGVSSASAAGAGALATNAALIESAAAASVAGGAAGGGLMATIGAAAPYIAAAIAIVTLLSKKGGGPKVSGAYNSAGLAGLPEGGELNNDVASLFGGVQSTYAGITQALGGTAGSLTGAAFIAKDPKGTANTQFVLDTVLNGQQVYSRNNRTSGGNVEDVGRDPAALSAAIDTASQQAVLRALQETNITPEIDAMIDAISATMGGDQIKAELLKVVQFKQQQDAANAPAASSTASTISAIDASNAAAMGSLSADYSQFLSLQGRTADAAELSAGRLAGLQTWFYDSAVAGANLTRQAIYDAAANDSVTRNSIVGELQLLRAEVTLLRTEQAAVGAAQGVAADRTAVATERTEQMLRNVSSDGTSITTRAAA